jgi:hypothetical protein
MKRHLLVMGFFILIFGCKKQDEGSVVAGFEFGRTTIYEGQNLPITNTSQYASVWEWNIPELGLENQSENPIFNLDTVGRFTLILKTKNGEGSQSQIEKLFEILPDTIWRLSKRSKKQWRILSLVMNGKENLVLPCQLDDNLDFSYFGTTTENTYSYTAGLDTCVTGTYNFPVPNNEIWSYGVTKGKLMLRFFVSGILETMNFELIFINKDYMIGKDLAKNAEIRLRVR